MKDRNWFAFLRPLLIPALLIVLGIVLIVNPDSAAALVGKVIAWALILGGTVMGITALSGEISRRLGRLIPAAVILILGIWLMSEPLFIAESLGWILGILLAVQGGADVFAALRGRQRFSVISAITLVAGVVLVLVPMTTSRILIVICGIVVLCIGAAELADRLLRKKLPPQKPDIIDEA